MPQTPRKLQQTKLPPTPVTNRRELNTLNPPRQEIKKPKLEEEESFGWSSSNDEDLLNAEREILLEQPAFQTPRKAARTQLLTSPGKRVYDEGNTKTIEEDGWSLSDDVFATPSTSHKSSTTGLLSPTNTPANIASQLDQTQPEPENSTLATEVLEILKSVKLSAGVERKLVDLLNKHHLRTQGILKGRDITRVAVAAKDAKIVELQSRISTLEAERETNRAVISHLKSDMAASPKRPRNQPPSRRSHV